MAGTARRLFAWQPAIAAAALALMCTGALAVTAFACTAAMGPLTLNPTSGPRGTVVTTSATGLAAHGNYRIAFSDAKRMSKGRSCMDAKKVLRDNVRTNREGAWSNVTVTIPANAPMGLSQICGMENSPVKNAIATTHEDFTVT